MSGLHRVKAKSSRDEAKKERRRNKALVAIAKANQKMSVRFGGGNFVDINISVGFARYLS